MVLHKEAVIVVVRRAIGKRSGGAHRTRRRWDQAAERRHASGAKVVPEGRRRMTSIRIQFERGGPMASSTKQVALDVIQQMPDDASLDEIMYQLYFRATIDRGLEELRTGKTVSHEEVKRSLAGWLQSIASNTGMRR